MTLPKIKRVTRTIYYTIVMYVVTHIIVFALFPVWSIRTLFNPASVRRIKKRFGVTLLRIIGKQLTISGIENIEKGKRYLIIANYPSFYTGFILMMLFPGASLLVHDFMSKVPVLSSMLKRNGFIYAHRKGFRKIKEAMNIVAEKSKGSSIIILPEGKRTPDGQIQEFKRGFIHILRHSFLELLPITLSGFYKLKPVNRLYIDTDTQLEVIIQKPISHATIKGLNDEELLTATVRAIEEFYRP